MSVFSSCKPILNEEARKAGPVKRVLGCIDVWTVIQVSYSESCTVCNIRSRFENIGLWNLTTLSESVEALKHLSFLIHTVQIYQLLRVFFLHLFVKEGIGSGGCGLTKFDCVLDVLKERQDNQLLQLWLKRDMTWLAKFDSHIQRVQQTYRGL